MFLHDKRFEQWTEPFAKDESVYNRRFAMWSDEEGVYDLPERDRFLPQRLVLDDMRRTDYFGRWNNKFVEMGTQIGGQHESGGYTYNNFDGNPFT